MGRVSEEQVKKLLDDISTIKSVISDNQPVFKQLLLPGHFTAVSYISGIGIIVVSMAYYFLLNRYEVYQAIPGGIKSTLLVIIAMLAVTVWILKGVLWMKSVRRINADLSFGQMLKGIYSGQIFHVWIPITCLFVILVFFFIKTGRPGQIVPLLCYGTGVMYNMIGGMTRAWQYLMTGYWVIMTGTLSLVMSEISGLLWLAVSLGVGLVMFAAASHKSRSSREL